MHIISKLLYIKFNMGSSESKIQHLTEDTKSIVNEFIFSIISSSGTIKSPISITMHQGNLLYSTHSLPLSNPNSCIKFTILSPISCTLQIFFQNGEIWTLSHNSFPTLLEFKKLLAISMRPQFRPTNGFCKKCSSRISKKTFQYCYLCGYGFCKTCSNNYTQLDFLGHIKDCPICEGCKDKVIQLKSEIREYYGETNALCRGHTNKFRSMAEDRNSLRDLIKTRSHEWIFSCRTDS